MTPLLAQGLLPVIAANPIVGVIAAIASFLVGFFGLFGNNLGGIIKAVQAVASWAGDMFRRTLNAIFPTVGGLLGKLLDDLWGKVKKLVTELGDLIGRAITLLKQLRDWLDRIYRDFVRPLLNLLQHVRQLLLLLRLLHIKLADKLDKLLARAQVLIAKPFLLVRGKINGILDVLEMMIHPTGALKGGPLLWGVWQEIGSLVRLISMARKRVSDVTTDIPLSHWKDTLTLSGSKAQMQANAAGIITPEQQDNWQDVRDAFTKEYGSVL